MLWVILQWFVVVKCGRWMCYIEEQGIRSVVEGLCPWWRWSVARACTCAGAVAWRVTIMTGTSSDNGVVGEAEREGRGASQTWQHWIGRSRRLVVLWRERYKFRCFIGAERKSETRSCLGMAGLYSAILHLSLALDKYE
jgi:hypothetical protein